MYILQKKKENLKIYKSNIKINKFVIQKLLIGDLILKRKCHNFVLELNQSLKEFF